MSRRRPRPAVFVRYDDGRAPAAVGSAGKRRSACGQRIWVPVPVGSSGFRRRQADFGCGGREMKGDGRGAAKRIHLRIRDVEEKTIANK